MTAKVDILTATSEDALTLPVQAVVKRRLDEDGEEVSGSDAKSYDEVDVVYLIEDDKAAVHEVVVGVSDVIYVEIIEGLAVGDEVMIGPYRTLKKMKHGDAVKVEEEKSDSKSAEDEESGGVEVRVE
jgi:HlyD family secretion protein